METYIPACPHCGSEKIRPHGSVREKPRWECQICKKKTHYPIRKEDIEIVTKSVKLAKQKQYFEDTNRIERKTFRRSARIDNALQKIYVSLMHLIESKNISKQVITHNKMAGDVILVVQVSDTHMNEVVDLANNKYDLDIARSRLGAYADKVLQYAKMHMVQKIIVTFTGDQVNSDRRVDEMLSMATARAKAMFIAMDAFKDFIFKLNTKYNIEVASVTGNESRLSQEQGWSQLSACENYDYIIHEGLKRILEGKKGIVFLPNDDPQEQVIRVYDKNILILHGYNLGKDTIKAIQQLKGKWATRGTVINYVLFGHEHEAYISDMFARSASLAGSNGYSDKFMHVDSRASQNLHIVYKEGYIDNIKIDLQEV